jgi:hypothetical protein
MTPLPPLPAMATETDPPATGLTGGDSLFSGLGTLGSSVCVAASEPAGRPLTSDADQFLRIFHRR